MHHAITSVPFVALVTLSFGGGTVSSDSITIGGPGSCSSEGTQDPGLLSDGVTPASAEVVLTLDTGAATLEIVVTNTSPVTAGVMNPLLTRLYLNAPAAITGMTLASQSSSGGVTPAYALDVGDTDTGLFGEFDLCLHDTGDIQGTIANPAADTYTVDASLLAISPVTFTLDLQGDLTGLVAADFLDLFSTIPPGSKPSHAAAKFQAGGCCDASAFINEGDACDNPGTSEMLGSPCGGTLSVTPAEPGGTTSVDYQGSTPAGMLALYYSRPGGTPFTFQGCTIFLRGGPASVGVFALDLDGDFHQDFVVPAHHLCGDQIVLQAFVLNRVVPPRFAEISNGVLVTLGS